LIVRRRRRRRRGRRGRRRRRRRKRRRRRSFPKLLVPSLFEAMVRLAFKADYLYVLA